MTDSGGDRRGAPRLGLLARASVIRRGSDERLPFAVRDLSVSGARLVGHTRLIENEWIHVELELDGEIVSLPAEVIRTDPQNAQAALVFREVSADARAAIERALAALLSRAHAGSRSVVLVIGAPTEIGETLARDLAQLGRGPRLCPTMVEAMWALHEPTIPIEAVIIHGDSGATAPLLELLSDQHAQLRRIVLFGDQLQSIDHGSSSRVDAVLRTPWRIRPLARALGIQSAESTLAMLPTGDDD